MKELLVKGDKSLNKEFVKLKVDDEDYDILSMFDWVAYQTPVGKVLKIKTKREYPNFKYKTWFGETLPTSSVGKHSTSLEDFMEHMLYSDRSWYMRSQLEFVNGDRTDFRKSNLRSKFKISNSRRTDEEISKLRCKMMGVEPKDIKPIIHNHHNPFGLNNMWVMSADPVPSHMKPTEVPHANRKGYVIIKARGTEYITRLIENRDEMMNYLRSELIKPEDMMSNNEIRPFYTTEGDITLFVIGVTVTQKLLNDLDGVVKYVTSLNLDEEDKMQELETIVGYLSATLK